jgi:NAD(P)-dependent dehydrogenase (short-subunit alcohol dehydrogenase family)
LSLHRRRVRRGGQIDGVRINCVCPHTAATEGVRRALETRRLDEIAPPPATVLSVKDVSDAVLRLIRDDSFSGRVLILTGESSRAFL